MANISADARELARRLTETVNQFADRGMTSDDSLQGLAYFFANFQLNLNDGATLQFLTLVRSCTEQLMDSEQSRIIIAGTPTGHA